MIKEQEKYYCMICENELDYVPQMCCSGYMCGCNGQPIEPPVCSSECYDKVMNGEHLKKVN